MRSPAIFTNLHWRDLSPSAAKLYLILLSLSTEKRRIRIRHVDLAKEADLTESTFRLARRKLQHCGLVTIRSGLGRGNESEWILLKVEDLYNGLVQRSEPMRKAVRGLSGTETKLLGAALFLADNTGRFRATLSKLQTLSGLGKDSIRTARKALRQRRMLDFQVQNGALTFYQLLQPASRVSQVEMSPVTGNGKAFADYTLTNTRKSKRVNSILSPSRDGEALARIQEELELQPHEIYAFINECSLLVGSVKYNPGRPGPGARLRKMLAARLKDGYTLKDLKRACQAAAADRANGSRWRMLSNLFYIWGNGLHSFLAKPADVPVATGGKRRRAPVFRKGEELESWRKGSTTEEQRHARVEDFIKRMGN